MKVTVRKQRKDGNFLVTYSFDGGPNGFGGNYPGRVFNKIESAATLQQYADILIDNTGVLNEQFKKHSKNK